MWSNIIVKINSTVVSEEMNLFPFKSIIPLLLTKGKSEVETLQTSALYYRDEPTYDTFDTTKNSGFANRVGLAASCQLTNF